MTDDHDNHGDGRDGDGGDGGDGREGQHSSGDTASRDYEVGYGKPPRHSRWPRGQSGNPKGRKKGTRGLKADLDAALKAKVTIPVLGKTRTDTTQGNAMYVLALKAAGGDMRAVRQLTDLILAMFGPGDRGGGENRLSALDRQLLERMLGNGDGESNVADAGAPGHADDAEDARSSKQGEENGDG